MEKQSNLFAVNNNDGTKLPIGYRFRPTDEELVVHYLKRKVFALPLPASVIPDLDVFHSHPLALPGDVREKKRYFFSNVLTSNGGRCKAAAAAGSGYWKHAGNTRQILASGFNNQQVVGVRRTLIFREGKHKHAHHENKTQWMMHEYHLVGIATDPNSPFLAPKMVVIGDWAVYGIFQRKKKPARKKHGDGGVSSPNKLQAADVITTEADDQPAASSCSNEITADDQFVSDQEETSACL